MNEFTLNNGGCQMNINGCCHNSIMKLAVFDWLCDLPEALPKCDLVEVQFKNTRKGYYINTDHLRLQKGDMVAVEAAPGHDIGEVTLTGDLVRYQMNKNHIDPERYPIRQIYRIAREADIEKLHEAQAREQETMIQARKFAAQLGLEMKIGDVEFQGDGTKAIFYYIADERVDFRQLIKVFAEHFRVRIEMKQIGARQEAGRIGGIGPCGRELCCTTWLTNFNSVGTGAARVQDISLNPQKLAGQCAKLKCCLNFELDMYQDALKDFLDRNIELETRDCTYYFFKADPLAGLAYYSTDRRAPINLECITAKRAHEVYELNKKGQKPDSLGGKQAKAEAVVELTYQNVVGQDDLTRFDRKPRQGGNKGRNGNRRENRRENFRDAHDANRDNNRGNRQRDRKPRNNDNKNQGNA